MHLIIKHRNTATYKFTPIIIILYDSFFVNMKSMNKRKVILHNLRHNNKIDVYTINFIGQFSLPAFAHMGEICKKCLKFLILLAFGAIM